MHSHWLVQRDSIKFKLKFKITFSPIYSFIFLFHSLVNWNCTPRNNCIYSLRNVSSLYALTGQTTCTFLYIAWCIGIKRIHCSSPHYFSYFHEQFDMFSFTSWQLQFEKGAPHSTLEWSWVHVGVCRPVLSLLRMFIIWPTLYLWAPTGAAWSLFHNSHPTANTATKLLFPTSVSTLIFYTVVVGTGCVYSFFSFIFFCPSGREFCIIVIFFFFKLWNNFKQVQGNLLGFVHISLRSIAIIYYGMIILPRTLFSPNPGCILLPDFSYYCRWWKMKLRSLIILLSLGKPPLWSNL